MKLIKISPKYQITIPKSLRPLCRSGWFSLSTEDDVLILRPIEIQEAKTHQEALDEILNSGT